MPYTWQITASVRFEGVIQAKDRETAMAEAESIIRGGIKNLQWLHAFDPSITATRKVFG